MRVSLHAIFLVAACAHSAGVLACFDDKKWQSLQSSDVGTLLYVWSPRMVLSAHNAATAQAAASALGLQFTAVYDGRLNPEEVAEALQQLAKHPDAGTRASASALRYSQPLCSPALEQRDALGHFPTAWVVRAFTSPAQPAQQNGQVVQQNALAARQGNATVPRQQSDLAMIGAMPAFAWDLGLRQRLGKP